MSPGKNKYAHMAGQASGCLQSVELVAHRCLESALTEYSSVCGLSDLACQEGLHLAFAQR